MRSDLTFALVLDTALDSVVVMNADGHVLEWNSKAEELFGWTRAEIMGQDMANFMIPLQHREAHRQGLAHYLATGVGPVLRKRIEITALTKAGLEIPVELSISPSQYNGAQIFIGFIRDARDKQEREHLLARQALLLAELEHRSKNMLALIMGMTNQTARGATSVESFKKALLGRLQSLGRAYGLLTAKDWESTNVSTLVEEVLRPHIPHERHFEFSGPHIVLPAKTALSISMVLHELATNASKYGALKHHGLVRLTVDHDGSRGWTNLHWLEQGVPGLVQPSRTGFGSKLISATVEHDLQGTIQHSYGSSGVEYRISFPTPQ